MEGVGIGRGVVNDGGVIVGDEGRGNLDRRRSFEIVVLFEKVYGEGRRIIFVSDNGDIGNYWSRNIEVGEGDIMSEE